MQYETLYTKDSHGNIRIWYMERDCSAYRTISGIQNGALVYSEWTYAEPKNIGKKNETSADEQADLEIKAKYKKQLKTGYSENIEDAGKTTYVEPLLANKYKDRIHKIKFNEPYILQIKFNGCLTGDSLIKTKEFGYKTIEYLVKNKIKCKVYSYNEQTKRNEYMSIKNYFINKKNTEKVEWYEIITENGEKLRLTGNHKVYLPDLKCWRMVKDLDGNENLMVL